ncbi:oligosaccharide flippase family protein [Pantoea allii]|uniref:oligosaccharide flippase family protein n=1 Tax=Pantoea allii TaxID=574096 RepID=UPI0024B6E50F|nr:oligosaccharide flippase family protein [Pantoea allii]MDJ0089603.1 oligosaccharide flippase family protein [Pantoea allii]
MAIRKINLINVNWPLLSSFKILSIGVLQLSLLGKILQADAFNLLAVVIAGLLVIDTLADRGFSNSVIRYSTLSVNRLSVIYWGNILLGLIIFAVFFISGIVVDRLFNQPQITMMLEMAAVIFIIIPQGQHYRAILQREKQFSDIAFCEISSVFVGLVITLLTVWSTPSILCALWGYLAMVSVRMLAYCCYGRIWFQPVYQFSLKTFFQICLRNI